MKHAKIRRQYGEVLEQVHEINQKLKLNTVESMNKEIELLTEQKKKIQELLAKPISELSDKELYARHSHLLLTKLKEEPFDNLEETLALSYEEIDKRKLDIAKMNKEEMDKLIESTKKMNMKLEETNKRHEQLKQQNKQKVNELEKRTEESEQQLFTQPLEDLTDSALMKRYSCFLMLQLQGTSIDNITQRIEETKQEIEKRRIDVFQWVKAESAKEEALYSP